MQTPTRSFAEPRTLVLLAGMDDAFRSRRPKWTHAITGRSMLRHALGDAAGAVWVHPSEAQPVQEAAGEATPAVLDGVAGVLEWIRSGDSDIVVASADVPFAARWLRGRETGVFLAVFHGEVLRALRCPARALAAALEGDAGIANPAEFRSTIIAALADAGFAVERGLPPDPEDAAPIIDRVDLAAAARRLQRAINAHWMREGVTIVDTDSVWIDSDVEIGPDTILLPGTTLAGRTRVGAECRIGPHVVAIDARMGDGCQIGPFAHLRPGTVLHDRVRIGNFVEVKNAELGERVAAGHLTYLGDAVVGAGTNIGAGVITCNYDGFSKHRTVIGESVFVGSHTTLVAPVSVGEGALTAAGSVVTKDVPADALAMGRARQENREGWAAARRERRARTHEKGQ